MDLNSTFTKNAPTILTGLNIAGLVTTVAFAVDATFKASKMLNKLNEEEQDGIEVTPVVKLKTIAPLYIPTVVMGGITIGCAVCSNSINARRTAALAAAYSLSETAAEVYRRKVRDVIGEKKENEVRGEVAREALDNAPPRDKEIIITGKESLCYETVSGRYFKSDYETLRKIRNDLNNRLISEMYISLNELFYELGLKDTTLGNDLGWNLDDGLIEFDITTQLSESGEPCIVLGYNVAPRYDYYKLH